MAVLKSKNNDHMYIDCHCGCNEGIRLIIDKDDYDYYCFLTYTNGNFYKEQGETVFKVLSNKFKKIWAIVRNKDFYYSDVTMTKDEFEEFKEYINSI